MGEAMPQPFHCAHCTMVFGSGESRDQHSRAKHGVAHHARPFACGACGRSFRTEEAREQHAAARHAGEPAVDAADRAAAADDAGNAPAVDAANAPALDAGNAQPQADALGAAPGVRCAACGRAFATAAILAQHARDKHGAPTARLGCRRCGR